MKISIIVPVYNEEILIGRCLDALINQDYPKNDYEIIVVNDGSTDKTLDCVKAIKGKTDCEINIVNLGKNQGRAIAREIGAKNARYDYLLFIDSRCIADGNILANLAKINYQPVVGNPIIDFNRSVFDRFNWLMRKKLYSKSFGGNFEQVYITEDNFDKVAKGTTVFFCARQLFLSSQLEFNDKTASDDTKLLWNITRKKKLLKHPDIRVAYWPRTNLKEIIKHTFNRGPKFVDYYFNPVKKYFWIFIFLPLLFLFSFLISAAANQVNIVCWAVFLVLILIIICIWLSECAKDFFVSFFILPAFALSFILGIWWGILRRFKRFLVKNRKALISFVFSIALLSGLFWNQKIFGQPISSDQELYNDIAQSILQGNGFTRAGRDMGMEPLYPLFLAGIYKIFGHNYDAVRIIQILLFALTVVFVYLLAEKLFGRKVAIWSSMATALFYGVANQAGSLTTETLFIFLIMFFVYAISNCKNIRWIAASGIVLGLAVLTRSIIQYFFILVVINFFVIFYKKTPIRKIFLKIGIFLISFFIILMPWLIREHSVSGDIAKIASRTGSGLASRVERMEKIYPNYAGHFIGRLFGYYFSEKLGYQVKYEDYRHVVDTDEQINDLLKSGKTKNEIDQILSSGAKKIILQEPHKYIAITFLDFISFNSPLLFQLSNFQNTLEIHPMFAEGRHPEIPEWGKAMIILTIRFVWFFFLFLAICGAIKIARNWAISGFIILIVLYFNFAYSAIHAIPRYALPIYPFYVILMVVGAFYLWNKCKVFIMMEKEQRSI